MYSFSFLFFVKTSHFESFAVCNFRGLDANHENRENKAPAGKKTPTIYSIHKHYYSFRLVPVDEEGRRLSHPDAASQSAAQQDGRQWPVGSFGGQIQSLKNSISAVN